jgi:flagellar assembly factor FliW
MTLSLTIPGAERDQAETELWLDSRSTGDRKVVEFPEGLLGFENAKHFIIVQREEYAPFQWLVSVDVPDLGFVIVDPSCFYPAYQPRVDERELKSIVGEIGKTLLVYAIVTVASEAKATTANLLAPILLCVETWKAKQVVLNEPRYSTRHRFKHNS